MIIGNVHYPFLYVFSLDQTFMCLCQNSSDTIVNIGSPGKIWAIPSIHSAHDQLVTIHDQLLEKFTAGDKLVYLGNYTGYGDSPVETLNELLTFRRILLSISGVLPSDIIYLRGGQEEILEKLWQLHFAPDAEQVLIWMLGNGLSPTLYAYDIDPHEVINTVRSGSKNVSKWINSTRNIMRKRLNDDLFYVQMKRAAYTDSPFNPLLLINAGLDHAQTLDHQNDNFWWGGFDFDDETEKYKEFEWVIRGFDPKHHGIFVRKHYATIDNGCGFGGDLISAAFDENGEIIDYLEA